MPYNVCCTSPTNADHEEALRHLAILHCLRHRIRYPQSAIIQAAYLVISKRRHIHIAGTDAWVVLCITKTANIRRWNIDQRASCRHASGPLASERSGQIVGIDRERERARTLAGSNANDCAAAS